MKSPLTLILSLIIELFAFFSCNKQEVMEPEFSHVEKIIVDTRKGVILPFDSLIEKIDFIKLETTDEILIGKISQLLFTDSLIIVVDGELSKAIYFFDLQGMFKYSIFRLGNGPGEYTEISHVNLVPSKNQIMLLDAPQHKINYYTMNGEYVSSELTPFMLYYFEYLDSGCKAYETTAMKDPAFGTNKNKSLIVTDFRNNIRYGAFEDLYNSDFNFVRHRPLRKFQSVYYSPNISNMIYEIKDTIIEAKYFIDIVWNGMPELHKDITDEQWEEYCKKYFFFNGDFIEMKDFTYINIATPQGYPSAIYSHNKKETFLSSGSGNHPFFVFLDAAPKARYKDNVIVVDVQPYIIHACKQDLYRGGKYTALLDSLFENLSEDSNPVLFFYHLNTDL
jgi:hypothetical protein